MAEVQFTPLAWGTTHCDRDLEPIKGESLSAFLQQAPITFFEGLSVVRRVFPQIEWAEQVLQLIPAEHALWIESHISSDQLSRVLAEWIPQIPSLRATSQPNDSETILTKIDLTLRDAAGGLPSLLELLQGSRLARDFAMDVYFDTVNRRPKTEDVARPLRLELDNWLETQVWPARKGPKEFQEFIEQMTQLKGKELEFVTRAYVHHYLMSYLVSQGSPEGVSRNDLYKKIVEFARADALPSSVQTPFFVRFLSSTVMGVRSQSGLRLKWQWLALIDGQLKRARERESYAQQRIDFHQQHRAQESPVEVSAIPRRLPVPQTTQELPVAAPILIPPVITSEAQKEMDVLQPRNLRRMEEFIKLASEGAGPLQLALRRQQGSWQLERLSPLRHFGRDLFSVRLDREFRVGFRILRETGGIEIVAVNKWFSHNREN